MNIIGDLAYNKDIWVILSGTVVRAADSVVVHEIERSAKQIFHGINYYQKPGSNIPSENELKLRVTKKMFSFVKLLEEFLVLDVNQAYDLLCYYVMYEYRGTPDSLHDIISNETKKAMLVQDIWLFYRSERMFLLKCINCIWTFCIDEEHPYQKHYGSLITRNSLAATFATHATQLKTIIQEVMPSSSSNTTYMTERIQDFWFASNLREQIQVLQNMILYLDFYGNCTGDEFKEMYHLFTHHAFGRSLQLDKYKTEDYSHIWELIGFLETIVLLQALDLPTLEKEDSYKLFIDIQLFETLDQEMSAMLGAMEEHGPLLLAWMVVNFSSTSKDPQLNLFKKFGDKAKKLNVFNYLARLLSNPWFKQCTALAKIASRCISQLLRGLADCFEINYLSHLPGVYAALAGVLSDPTEANLLWESEADQSGLWIYVNSAMMAFPRQFEPLVMIMEALALSSTDNITKLLHILRDLSTYAEAVDLDVICTKLMPGMSPTVSILAEPYRPRGPGAYFTMGALTRGVLDVADGSIMWQHNFNFFLMASQTESELLRQISNGSTYVQLDCLQNVTTIVNFLAKLLSKLSIITPDIADASEMIFPLMDKFSFQASVSVSLLCGCLNTATALLKSSPKLVCDRMKCMSFLPSVNLLKCSDPQILAGGQYLELNAIGKVVVEEYLSGKYPLLMAYLRFIEEVMQPRDGILFEKNLEDNLELILPALVMVVCVIFPNYDTWIYKEDEMDKSVIGHCCIRMLHQILTITSLNPNQPFPTTGVLVKEGWKEMEEVRRDSHLILSTICLHSLLFTDTCVPLLKLVSCGDRYIQTFMERQPSWIEGNSVLFTNNVQLAMSVLNRVLMLKPMMHHGTTNCRIEYFLYSRPTPTPSSSHYRVCLNVANYIYYCFNRKLQVLAMKLFKRFVQVFPVSIMSCLGTEASTICQTLVSRLDSSIESDELKVALLEVMASTIGTQSGLAETFINFHQPSVPDERGGCLLYACSILQKLTKDPSEVSVGIHEGVVGLLYAIWTGPTQKVCEYLREKPGFWEGLLTPLFLKQNEHELQVYCQIISIISQELFLFHGKVCKPLENVLARLFNEEEPFFKDWMEYVALQLKTSRKEMVKSLLTVWKELITVLIKNCPIVITTKMKCSMAHLSMKILIQEVNACVDINTIKQAVEFNLAVVSNWKEICIGDHQVAVQDLVNFLSLVSMTYRSFSPPRKELLIGVALRYMCLLSREIKEDESVSESLLQICCELTTLEFTLITTPKKQETTPPNAVIRQPIPCELCCCMLQKLVSILRGTIGWVKQFREAKIVSQLLDVTKFALETPEYVGLAEINLRLILLLCDTEFALTLVAYEIGNWLWISLLPPKRYKTVKDKQWHETKWRDVYCHGLEIVTCLLDREQFAFVQDTISFVGIHEEELISILTSVRTSMKQASMQLVITTLHLVRQLQRFKDIWQMHHQVSFVSVMTAVMSTLDTCVAFLTLPHLLYVLVEKPVIQSRRDLEVIEVMDISPSPQMSQVQNRLLECSCICLLAINPLWPTFHNLISNVRENDLYDSLIIDISFTAPSLQRCTLGRLSFGTLVTLINLCTQTLANKGHGSVSPLGLSASPSKALKTSEKWLLSLDRAMVLLTLQQGLAAILAEGIIALKDRRLLPPDQVQFKREIMTELTPYFDYVKRNSIAEESRTLKRSAEDHRRSYHRPGSSSHSSTQPTTVTLDASPPEENPLKKVDEQANRYFQLIAHLCQCVFR